MKFQYPLDKGPFLLPTSDSLSAAITLSSNLNSSSGESYLSLVLLRDARVIFTLRNYPTLDEDH